VSDTTDEGEAIADNIEPIDIQEEMEQSFLEYAMSVIVSRALPDARDGLKPVHRRILWAMDEAGRRPDRNHVKCATVVGDVIGKYHPHGDSSIYDALVRLGQSFSLRHTLIDPHGNFGSPSDPPAAYRYTECRLTQLAMHMLADIGEDAVELVPNFDGSHDEPVVLPSRFPNLLVNGGQGIAVGMATNIPPHNLGEVVDATLHLLDNPQASVEDLMEFVKGPDFPTGGQVLGRKGIEQAYQTGRGSFKIRGDAEIIEDSKGGQKIVVSSFPYQTSVEQIADKAAEAVKAQRIDGISSIKNLSAQGKTELVFELKRGAPGIVVLNSLYKFTPLQISYSINMVALDDGVPRTLSLRDALVCYVDHQVDVIRRRTTFRLEKAQRDLHIREGLLRAVNVIDEIIALIRASDDKAAAREGLQAEPFEFSYEQSDAILEMTLGQLTRLARVDLEEKVADLQTQIAELEGILADDKILRGVIREEMSEIRENFAADRLSTIGFDPGEMNIEDLIDDEDLVFTMSDTGYVKTTSTREFRTQGRGGRGVAGANLKDEDFVVHMIHTSAHAYLLFFSNRGRVYRLKAHEIPNAARTARGTAIVNLLPLQEEETIEAIIDTRDYETSRFLFFATKLGRVKKTLFNAYDSSLKAGLIAIKLNDGDELVEVMPTDGSDQILLVSRNGQVLRITEESVRPMGRSAAGVRGMKFREGDHLIGCDRVKENHKLLIVTEAGFGKRTEVEAFSQKGRAGLGVRGMKTTEDKGKVAGAFMVPEDGEVFLVTSGAALIRMAAAGISEQGRDATGVTVMNLGEGERVAAIAPAPPEEVDEFDIDDADESDALDGVGTIENAEGASDATAVGIDDEMPGESTDTASPESDASDAEDPSVGAGPEASEDRAELAEDEEDEA